MSGSEGASASRKPPPLPPGAEPTIAIERSPPVANKSKVDSLLPPGAEEAAPPMSQAVASSPPPFAMPAQVATAEIKLAPVVVAAKEQATSLERAERRFWRNAIVFGVSIVVLLAVFYWLAR